VIGQPRPEARAALSMTMSSCTRRVGFPGLVGPLQ
jgi:hypothetical protein